MDDGFNHTHYVVSKTLLAAITYHGRTHARTYIVKDPVVGHIFHSVTKIFVFTVCQIVPTNMGHLLYQGRVLPKQLAPGTFVPCGYICNLQCNTYVT